MFKSYLSYSDRDNGTRISTILEKLNPILYDDGKSYDNRNIDFYVERKVSKSQFNHRIETIRDINDQNQFTLVLNGQHQNVTTATIALDSFVHIAMCAHPNPKRVLILGGMDGSAAYEVLQYSGVEQVVVVDVDIQVYFAVVMSSPHFRQKEVFYENRDRTQIHITDALNFLKQTFDRFDVVLTHISDVDYPPGTLRRGPEATLDFDQLYGHIQHVLTRNGILATQLKCGRSKEDFLSFFPRVNSCGGNFRPGSEFIFASKNPHNPLNIPLRAPPTGENAPWYYTPERHRDAFGFEDTTEQTKAARLLHEAIERERQEKARSVSRSRTPRSAGKQSPAAAKKTAGSASKAAELVTPTRTPRGASQPRGTSTPLPKTTSIRSTSTPKTRQTGGTNPTPTPVTPVTSTTRRGKANSSPADIYSTPKTALSTVRSSTPRTSRSTGEKVSAEKKGWNSTGTNSTSKLPKSPTVSATKPTKTAKPAKPTKSPRAARSGTSVLDLGTEEGKKKLGKRRSSRL